MANPSHPTQRIVLTGFMGSGKTTVGRLLAETLGYGFVDLDHVVEQKAGVTIAELFAQHGEAAFRQCETAALAASLNGSRLVLALGGGAPETPENRRLLTDSGDTIVIYLAAPFATLEARCATQSSDLSLPVRPVMADRAEAERRFVRRQPLYESLAHITLDTGAQTPKQTAQQIREMVVAPGVQE